MLTKERLNNINKSLIEKAKSNSNKLFILFWEDKWLLRKEGTQSIYSSYSTLEEAERMAKEMLVVGEVSSIIKTNIKGQLVDKITYSDQGTFVISNLGYF